MADTNALIRMIENDGSYTMQIENISPSNIPAELNGESGHHIYHVRMLTELILKELVKADSRYALTGEDIENISIASSLHDIGKSKIPKSILDYPGRLSSYEYELVKRHSAFGESIIKSAGGDIAPSIVGYACDIARYHHERIDGSGYPDYLTGEDIPIWARVVSLADSFDALISERSYKKAIAEDVAIEMITNGMCGAFDSFLIDSLLKVVNHRILVNIRESISCDRAVVSKEVYTPERVLFAGNTGYITREFIERSFPDSRIVIAGDSGLEQTKGLRIYKKGIASYKKLVETYDFDIIIYLAAELSLGADIDSDAEDLRFLLASTHDYGKKSRIMYFSSLDSAFSEGSDRALLSRAKEELCEYWEKNHGLDIKTVRIPYLYSGSYSEDFLYKAFAAMRDGGRVSWDFKPGSVAYFISMFDLAELIVRFVDSWKTGTGILSVNDTFSVSFGDIYNSILEYYPTGRIDFTGKLDGRSFKQNNKALRNEYGYFSKISIIDDMAEEHDKFELGCKRPVYSFLDKLRVWAKEHKGAVKLIELFALFILCEALMLLTDSTLIFKIVDFRMAYIVIISVTYGLSYAMAASALSSLSYLAAKLVSGTGLITMFYEPTNWLAFVFFFLVGGLCGYVRLKDDDRIKDLNEKNELLADKLIFTRELYSDAQMEKRDLKKQIIGSKDSFGKIFDVTRSFDTVEPRKLYLKLIESFEEILENKSISIYSVDANAAWGRLELASRDILGSMERSISLEKYQEAIKLAVNNEVWRNKDLTPGMPMYIMGICREDKPLLLIFIWHTSQEQRSLYYVNLFKILSELAEMSLLRAYDYTNAVQEKQYISGTRILNNDAFLKVAANIEAMADKKFLSYIRLKVKANGRTMEEMDKILSGKVRATDIMGADEMGDVIVLLSQASEEDLKFILPRFEDLDTELF